MSSHCFLSQIVQIYALAQANPAQPLQRQFCVLSSATKVLVFRFHRPSLARDASHFSKSSRHSVQQKSRPAPIGSSQL
ncbi:hypothetical protein RR42_m1440 [Cupriavidus basilensis]|uniref:Uncharacterized protein n=1 Tax=Cupriavidus basilensis TaxID=68895 RepID=A0A0C4YDK9_9BURK|nr:hypothetical protein RR42_m1440 [Cupriavidus basilensis]